MLTSIKIEKLFDIFDYDIEFKEEGIYHFNWAERLR